MQVLALFAQAHLESRLASALEQELRPPPEALLAPPRQALVRLRPLLARHEGCFELSDVGFSLFCSNFGLRECLLIGVDSRLWGADALARLSQFAVQCGYLFRLLLFFGLGNALLESLYLFP